MNRTMLIDFVFALLCFVVAYATAAWQVRPFTPVQAVKARAAIEACEKPLPRDQVCEVVITARVKVLP